MEKILRLPGLIDIHVHFREPGQTHKEDFESGSRAALAGGVRAVVDMPNNAELVTTLEQILMKKELALLYSHCDMGFHLGTRGAKDQNFRECEPEVFGLKIYMNDTTGGYVVSDYATLESIFRRWESEKPILVHAEGNTLAIAIALAEKYNRRLHVCHVSLADEVRQIRDAKYKRGNRVTAEVTPHHLSESSLWTANPFARMRPPLSDFPDMAMLWQALNDGTIDVVATDHAPHTREEKLSENPPFGVTGLETSLAVMLMGERAKKITLSRILEVMYHNPAAIFGFTEEPDTYIEVQRGDQWEVRGAELQTKAQTSIFEGRYLQDKVVKFVLRGEVVYENGEILNQPGAGKVLVPRAA